MYRRLLLYLIKPLYNITYIHIYRYINIINSNIFITLYNQISLANKYYNEEVKIIIIIIIIIIQIYGYYDNNNNNDYEFQIYMAKKITIHLYFSLSFSLFDSLFYVVEISRENFICIIILFIMEKKKNINCLKKRERERGKKEEGGWNILLP